jgi:hypothetical protein
MVECVWVCVCGGGGERGSGVVEESWSGWGALRICVAGAEQCVWFMNTPAYDRGDHHTRVCSVTLPSPTHPHPLPLTPGTRGAGSAAVNDHMRR